MLPEIAVFSGDTVRMDDEGFLYFVGRRDEMIKTSGYRVSPTEIEEVLYGTQLVGEVRGVRRAAPDARPGDRRRRDAATAAPRSTKRRLLAACRERLPAYMVPARIDVRAGPLPRNPNGKIDRKAAEFAELFERRPVAVDDARIEWIRAPAIEPCQR